MQENTNIALSVNEVEALNINFNADTVYSTLNHHLKEVEALIFSYHYHKKERIFDLVIDESSLKVDNTKASFKAKYQIGIFNACADVDHTDYTSMIINVNYSKDQSLMVLTGEYWPERGQDEI